MLTIQAQSNVPTDFGMCAVYAFSENENDWCPHLVLVAEKTDFNEVVNDKNLNLAYFGIKKWLNLD